MYTMSNNKIERDGVVVATINNGELDFLEGMARFRAPAVKFYNKNKKAKNEFPTSNDNSGTSDSKSTDTKTEATDGDRVPAITGKEKKEEKAVEDKTYLERLSDLLGVDINHPHPRYGWRRNSVCAVLKRSYNTIFKSDNFTDEEKRAIFNQFM